MCEVQRTELTRLYLLKLDMKHNRPIRYIGKEKQEYGLISLAHTSVRQLEEYAPTRKQLLVDEDD